MQDPYLSPCPGHTPLLTDSSPSSALPLALPGAMWTPWAPGPGRRVSGCPHSGCRAGGRLWSSEALAAACPGQGLPRPPRAPRSDRPGWPQPEGGGPAPPMGEGDQQFPEGASQAVPGPRSQGAHSPAFSEMWKSVPSFQKHSSSSSFSAGRGRGGAQETHPIHPPLPTQPR